MTEEEKMENKWQHTKDIKQEDDEGKNVKTKVFFHDELIAAIKNDKKEIFAWCLKKIRTEWHVARTVPVEQLGDFINYMWDNRNEIQNGTYRYWESDESKDLKINKGNNKYFYAVSRPYSYESKVCFVISPRKYYLIYDGNNCKALKAKGYKDGEVAVENFHETAKKFMQKMDPKPKTNNDYFTEDYKLWASQKNLKK